MDDQFITAMRASIARTDELHAQQVAELEKTIAGLQEVLRELADSALRLVEINAPRDPTDTVIIEEVIRRANKSLEYLEPPSH
jgi:hypothetical protein